MIGARRKKAKHDQSGDFRFRRGVHVVALRGLRRYERERGLPEELIRKINSANHLENAWARFERAELDLDGFDAAFAAEAKAFGFDLPGRDVIPLLSGDVRPEMVEALRRIKTRFKTGCITNNVPSMQAIGADKPDNLYRREIVEMFDSLIESSKVGLRKPDPRIYTMMCEALSVAPEECVYLDDLGGNLKPARAMGMITIKVENAPAGDHGTGSGDGNALKLTQR